MMGDVKDPETMKAKGNAAVKEGDFAGAEEFYREALRAVEAKGEGDAAPLHSNLSLVLLKLGKDKEALEEAQRCLECKDSWYKAHFRVGEAQFALKEYAAAAVSYESAIKLAGDSAPDLTRRLALAKEAQQGFFFRQLLAGRDFCATPTNPIEAQIFSAGKQMQNFMYLVGDAHTRECVIVDAAWDVKAIHKVVEENSMKLVGAVVTHYHFDHTGGVPPPPFDAFGITVPGIREMAVDAHLPVYVNRHDALNLRDKNKVPEASIRELEDGAEVMVGGIRLRFLHTPGHTPGSQCVFIASAPGKAEGLLLSGDTLFIGSCGRTDLPDCDNSAMYASLQKTLGALPEATRVYPGHQYGGFLTTIGQEKVEGLLKPMSSTEWAAMHSRS